MKILLHMTTMLEQVYFKIHLFSVLFIEFLRLLKKCGGEHSFVKFWKDVCPSNEARHADESVLAIGSLMSFSSLSVGWTPHGHTPE